MYNLVLTVLMLQGNQLMVKENIIPDPYKTYDECKIMIPVAQEHVNRIAKESNTVPGRVSCKLYTGV